MRLDLLLLLYAACGQSASASAPDADAARRVKRKEEEVPDETPLFVGCDKENTMCFAYCDGTDYIKLNRAPAADCTLGLRIEMIDDYTWDLKLRQDKNPLAYKKIAANITKDEQPLWAFDTRSAFKDEKRVKVEVIYHKGADVHAKLYAHEGPDRDPIIDTFHFTYGNTKICMMTHRIRDDDKFYACTEDLRSTVFNKVCVKGVINSGCMKNQPNCTEAPDEGNHFLCPESFQNEVPSLFVVDRLLPRDNEIICSQGGWRSQPKQLDPMSRIGPVWIKGPGSATCHNLCAERFFNNTGSSEKEQLTYTDYKVKCKEPTYVPFVDGRPMSSGLNCDPAKSEWRNGEKPIAPDDYGKIHAKCRSLLEDSLPNKCTEIGHSDGACAKFSKTDAIINSKLLCEDSESALVVYKSKRYDTLVYDGNRGYWLDDKAVVGNAHDPDRGYCVDVCDQHFYDTDCKGAKGCTSPMFKENSLEHYTISLYCGMSKSQLISLKVGARREVLAAAGLSCSRGGWSSGDKGKIAVRKDIMQQKEAQILCIDVCTFITDGCNVEEDATCEKIIEKEGAISCNKDMIIAVSARDQSTNEKKMSLNLTAVTNMQCSEKGWTTDNTRTLIDFSKHKLNNLTASCHFKCSPKFTKCDPPCPKREGNKLLVGTSSVIWINRIPTKESIECDEKIGWSEVNSKKVVVDFTKTSNIVNVSFGDVCSSSMIISGCEGHPNCKIPTGDLNGRFTCGENHIMKVNNELLEPKSMTCTESSWTFGTLPAIERDTPDAKIQLACLSFCDHSFIKEPACIAKRTCEKVKYEKSQMECPPKHYLKISTEEIPFETELVCDESKGWTEKKDKRMIHAFGGKMFEFEAQCLNRCGRHRLPDSDDVNIALVDGALSCAAGYMMSINDQNIEEEVFCDEKGFKKASGEVLMEFKLENWDDLLLVDCFTKCFFTRVKPYCNQTACKIVPKVEDGKEVSCTNENDILFFNNEAVIDRRVKCDMKIGWVDDGGFPVHRFVKHEKRHNLYATCRDFCSDDMYKEMSATKKIHRDQGVLSCPSNRDRLYVNNVMNGPVFCNKTGWIRAVDGSTALAFDRGDLEPVHMECVHQCDTRNAHQICDGDTICENATLSQKTVFCKDSTQVLFMEHDALPGKTSVHLISTSLSCSEQGWSDEKTLLIDLAKTDNHIFRVKCVQPCHKDVIKKTKAVNYTLGTPLTCAKKTDKLLYKINNGSFLMPYTELHCGKEGWKNDKGDLVLKFVEDKKNFPPTLHAKCEPNECLKPGFAFATACNGTSGGQCTEPHYTAYKMFCPAPYSLMPNTRKKSDTIYSDIYCNNGIWADLNGTVIPETKTNPMLLQCFARQCVKCKDTLKQSCKPGKDANCGKNRFEMGSDTSCSRYKCDSGWWRIASKFRVARYAPGFVFCDGNGTKFVDSLGTTIEDDETLDCITEVPCNRYSPLNMDCKGLRVECIKDLMKTSEKRLECPAPNSFFAEFAVNDWEELDDSTLLCGKDGLWKEPTHPELDGYKAGARVVCAASMPTAVDPSVLPGHLCHSCGVALKDLLQDDYNKARISLEGGVCIGKFTRGLRLRLSEYAEPVDTIQCSIDDEDAVWKRDDGEKITDVMALESAENAATAGTKTAGIFAVVLLMSCGVACGVLLVIWFHKRETQKYERMCTQGLEQKIDDYVDSDKYEEAELKL